MRRSALALAAVGLVAGCGGAGSSDHAGAGTSLTIVVTPDQGARAMTMTLRCDPAGGDHPQPKQACAVLATAGASVFREVPAGRACTEVYGGPQVARVTGTYAGEKVDATFRRTNGCEIDRWERLGTTFFAVPLQ